MRNTDSWGKPPSQSNPSPVPPLSYLQIQEKRLQMVVITSLLLVIIFLAIRATKMWNPLEIFSDPLFLAIPAGFVILVLLQNPQWGLVLLSAAALVVPFQIRTGTVTRLNAAFLLIGLLLGLWVFKLIVEKHRRIPIVSSTVLPMVVFLVVVLMSFVIGQLPWFMYAERASMGAQIGGLSIFILSVGVFLFVAANVREVRILEWITWIFLAIAGLHVIGRLIPGMGFLNQYVLQGGTFSSSMFWLWIMALAFSQLLFNDRLHPFWRGMLGLLLAGALYISLGQESEWTSGWLPGGVAMAVVLIASRSPFAWLSVVGAAGALFLKRESFRNLLVAGDNQYGIVTRLEAWRIIGEIVQVNPVFGLGPANYYWYTPMYAILGYYVNFNSHNQYVDIIAQAGLLGLAAFIWFAVAFGLEAWRMRYHYEGGFERAYVFGVIGGFAGMLAAGMLGDWFFPFVYNVGLIGFRASSLAWVFLGGLVALEQIRLAKQNPSVPQASQKKRAKAAIPVVTD